MGAVSLGLVNSSLATALGVGLRTTAASASAKETATYTVSIYTSLESCAAAWRLFEQDAVATIFQTYGWLECWQRTVGEARASRPHIAFVNDKTGSPVMILPLALENILGVSTLTWMARDEADYHAPLMTKEFAATCTAADMQHILTRIARHVSSADALSLIKTVHIFDSALNPLTHMQHLPHPSAAHAISLHGTFDELYADKRSKSTRRKDRQRRQRIEAMGDLKFEIAQTPQQRHDMLISLLSQKAAWLEARGITNPFAADDVQAFLQSLIDDPSAAAALHISAMTLNGEVIAGNLGYTRGNRFYAMIGTIADGDVARQSPGIVHLHELLKWCFDNDISIFDLTVGDEGYKKDWCDMRQDLVDIRLPLSIAGYLATAILRAKDMAKRAIKSSPGLFTFALAARRTLKTIVPK